MKTPVLILHGWGLFGKKYQALEKLLEKEGYVVYAPDFPGFGHEPLFKAGMVLDDYVDFIRAYLKKNKLQKVNIIAHSFGGRVAAKLTARYPDLIDKLVISGSPLIKTPLSYKKRIFVTISRIGKKLTFWLPQPVVKGIRYLLYYTLGEWDYYNARDLQKTFINIVNEDLSMVLPLIQAPVLLVWGADEKMVSVAIGQAITRAIPKATFLTIPGAGHRVPYDNPQEFFEVIKKFLKS